MNGLYEIDEALEILQDVMNYSEEQRWEAVMSVLVELLKENGHDLYQV